MSSCRSCGKEWPEAYAVCPQDGSPLVSAVDVTLLTSSAGGALPAVAVSASDELAAGSLAGDYEIITKIGEGGMGSVYGARHPLIGKRVAIKVIHRALSASAEAIERFIREAQAVNQIGHPNIVDVFGFGSLPDDRRFFVMEWLQGEPLSRRLDRPLPVAEALEILESIVKALEAAHEAGVLHRDLKPDNVFLQERRDDRSQVKLLDFGLAKLSGPSEPGLEQTRSGVVMGTPLYLSPEQAKGSKVDFATDIYSLGAMAYEMFSGHVPFKADSAVETMAMHISQPPIPLARVKPELPPAIDQLVRGMLEKEPSRRPTIAVVREQIAALRAPGALTARHSAPAGVASALVHSDVALASPAAAPRRRARTPWVIAVAALALIVAAGLVIAIVPGAGEPSPTRAPAEEVVAAAPAVAAPASPPVEASPIEAPPVEAPPVEAPPVEAPPVVRRPPSERAAPPERTPRRGTVAISIVGPRRAEISIDGKLVGRGVAKLTRSLSPGEHVVSAEAKGHAPARTTVKIVAGRSHEVSLALKRRTSINAVHDPFAED